MEKNIKIAIRKDSLSPSWKVIEALFNDLQAGERVKVQSFVSPERENGYFRLYVDDPTERKNRYARIESVKDDAGNEVSDEDFKEIIAAGKYTAVIYSIADGKGEAVISYEVDENRTDKGTDLSIDPEVSALIEEKISAGIISEAEGMIRVSYMVKNYVNRLDILDVIRSWDETCRFGAAPALYVDPLLEVRHKQGKNGVVARCIQSVLTGHPKILKGPKSTGKNTLINTIAWLFGALVMEHTFTLQDTPQDVICSQGTDNSASDAVGVFDNETLVRAQKIRAAHAADSSLSYSKEEDEILLAEAVFKKLSAQAASVHLIHEYRAYARWLLSSDRCFFVGDEMNMADANLLLGLFHPILDGSVTEIDIPGRGSVPLKKDLMMFATMNCGYAGEQESNSATMSRFGAFELGQPASIKGILHSAMEYQLRKYGLGKDLPEKYYNQAEAFYMGCKEAVVKGSSELSDQCLNIRGIIRALVEVKRFEGRTSLNEKLEDEVVTPCDDAERPVLMGFLNAAVNC